MKKEENTPTQEKTKMPAKTSKPAKTAKAPKAKKEKLLRPQRLQRNSKLILQKNCQSFSKKLTHKSSWIKKSWASFIFPKTKNIFSLFLKKAAKTKKTLPYSLFLQTLLLKKKN